MSRSKSNPAHRTPLFIISFVAILAISQLVALGGQFYQGFRPFGEQPKRVTLSWDMFANRVERCDLRWTPAFRTPGGPFSSIRDLGTALEWDVAYDHVSDYRLAARLICRLSGGGVHFHLNCFLPEGKPLQDDFNCGT